MDGEDEWRGDVDLGSGAPPPAIESVGAPRVGRPLLGTLALSATGLAMLYVVARYTARQRQRERRRLLREAQADLHE